MRSSTHIHKAALYGLMLMLISGCSSEFYSNKGNEEFSKYSYVKAIEYYHKSLKKKDDRSVKSKLADSYRLINNTEMAELYYKQSIIDSIGQAALFKYYSRMLMENGKHSDAEYILAKFLTKNPDDLEANLLVDCCRKVETLNKDADQYNIKEVNIPGLLNAFSPVEYKDGIIVSGEIEAGGEIKENPWTGNSYLNLYYVKKDENSNYMFPKMLAGINSEYHEASASFAEDGTMFFTRSNVKDGKLTKDEKNVNHLKIYSATFKWPDWTNIAELPINSNNFSSGHPSVSRDGNLLFFTSDRPGGFGGSDIYYCRKENGEWSEPVNAGNKINTSSNEMFPHLTNDNQLFFSSDGKIGLGGLDIYSSKFNGTEFSETKNLGYPLNSTRDDFGFVLKNKGKSGYLSSTRTGSDRIYEFDKPDPVFIVKGKVTDRKTGELLKDAMITITNTKDKTKKTLVTDQNGVYSYNININEDLELYGSNFEYFKSGSQYISTTGKEKSEEFFIDFALEKIEMEKPITIPNIYYNLNSWELLPASREGLDKLVLLMQENPSINIELSSHTDARASAKYNQTLSQKRAQSAVDYIISKKIDSSRIIAKGYGEKQLLNQCGDNVKCSEEEHTINRRTEFKVIKLAAGTTANAAN